MDSNLLSQWKEQYGEIYSFTHRTTEYIFRAATYKECRIAATPVGEDWSTAEAEDMLVDICLLAPRENFDRVPAGIISSLAHEIQKVSGSGTPQWVRGVLDEKRATVQGVEYLMKAFVITTMPTLTLEELDDLTFQQLSLKVAFAEQIIKIEQAIASGGDVSLEVIDPVEEAEKENRQRQKHTTSRKPGQAGYDDPVASKLRQALGG